jgi:hypothetical protein
VLKIEEEYNKLCDEYGVRRNFLILNNWGGERPESEILKYLDEESTPLIDFMVLSTKGKSYYEHHKEEYLGSVAQRLITMKHKINILLVL